MNDYYKNVNLGYACINLSIKPKVCCNKTCRLATIEKHYDSGEEDAVFAFLTDLALKNLQSVKKIIEWHSQNNLKFYRLSSDLIPHISQPRLGEFLNESQLQNYQNLEFAKELISEIGVLAYSSGIRLTMHPGHYNQLGSPRESVVQNTFTDLRWQCLILDIMESAVNDKFGVADSMKNSILCIHGGGTYNDKTTTLKRWIENFRKLDPNIQRRIAVENCEKAYCVQDLLPICEELQIPLIFDFHHYNCYKNYNPNFVQKSAEELLPLIVQTWTVRNMKPKFHLSDQAEGKAVGAHHDYVEEIPWELFALIESGQPLDIMIEAKCKDLAMFRLLRKYPRLVNDCVVPPENQN